MLEKILDEGTENDDRISFSDPELIAKGQYKSDPDRIVRGFKVFQKKHVYGSTIFMLVLVVLAILSQVLAMRGENSDPTFNVMLIIICVFVGAWTALRPYNTLKKIKKAVETLGDSIYEAEIYPDRVKISTIYDAPLENGETVDTEALASSEKEGDEAVEGARINTVTGEEEEIPATIIHLDNPAVEVTECEDMYVIYIKKVNNYVIPKSAFTEEENEAVRDKLTELMGVRYTAG